MLTALKEQTANSVVQCIAQVISAKKKKRMAHPCLSDIHFDYAFISSLHNLTDLCFLYCHLSSNF